MARLLARLGGFSARRPWLIIVGWILALAAAGGGYLLSGGALANGFSIPGTPTQAVTDRLSEELDGVGGAVGTIVFQTDDGSAFTAQQQEAISAALDETTDLDHVANVVDPFATADQKAQQAQQLADGQTQLDAGQAQLDTAQAQAEAAGMGDALAAQFAEQQAQIDAQRELLDLGAQLFANASEVATVSANDSTAIGAVVFDDTLLDLDPADRLAVLGLDPRCRPSTALRCTSRLNLPTRSVASSGLVKSPAC